MGRFVFVLIAYQMILQLGSVAHGDEFSDMLRRILEIETKIMNATTSPAPQCEITNAASRSCKELSSDEIAARCVAGRKSLGSIEVSGQFSLPCSSKRKYLFFGPKVRNEIPYRYRTGIEAGKIFVEQKVCFLGLTNREQDTKFRELFELALPRVMFFYAKQGLDYRLRYATDLENSNLTGCDMKVKIDQAREQRSHSRNWHIGHYLDVPATGNPIMFDDWLFTTTHELAHLLGVPDDYLEEEQFCKDIFGKKGRNSQRQTTLPCPRGLRELGAGFCPNLMQARLEDFRMFTLAPDSFFHIIAKNCPEACTFMDDELKYSDDDTPVKKSKFLGELKPALELWTQAAEKERSLKSTFRQRVAYLRSVAKLGTLPEALRNELREKLEKKGRRGLWTIESDSAIGKLLDPNWELPGDLMSQSVPRLKAVIDQLEAGPAELYKDHPTRIAYEDLMRDVRSSILSNWCAIEILDSTEVPK